MSRSFQQSDSKKKYLIILSLIITILVITAIFFYVQHPDPLPQAQSRTLSYASKLTDLTLDMLPDDGSPKHKTRLFAFVTTSSNYEKMARLRKQWHRNLKLLPKETDAKLFFIVGELDMNFNKRPDEELQRLRNLNATTGDILIAKGVTDTQKHIGGFCPEVPVSSTTQKVLWAIKWAVRHYKFEYLARVGDDAYFRVDHFLNNVAATQPKERLYMGHFYGPIPACTNQLDGIRHKYALGMGYIFTYDVAYQLAMMDARMTRFDEPEDGTVALWVSGLNLNRVHDTRFHNVKRMQGLKPIVENYHAWAPCSEDDILLHYVNGDMWDAIDAQGVMHCTEEHYGPKCSKSLGCPNEKNPLDGSGLVMEHAMLCTP